MSTPSNSVLIIGAGLCGLTLAYRLKKAGITAMILEARERIGGRILTHYLDSGLSIEMGATWLGKKHVHLVNLLEELAIDISPQFMGDYAIYEPISTSPPQLVTLPPNPEPSYRIEGGSQRLIDRLSEQLDKDQILLEQVVHSIQYSGNTLLVTTQSQRFEAKVVISTLPPFLLQQRVQFEPALPQKVLETATQTHTWMGESIKVGLGYREAFWRDSKSSGTIFSNVGPLTEFYDHSKGPEGPYGLKGFMNGAFHPAKLNERRKRVLEQLEKYYGTVVWEFSDYEEYVWRNDPFTFIDYPGFVLPHQNNGNPVFRQPIWDDRLFLAGSETAQAFPGYMDGAVQRGNEVAAQVTGRKPNLDFRY